MTMRRAYGVVPLPDVGGTPTQARSALEQSVPASASFDPHWTVSTTSLTPGNRTLLMPRSTKRATMVVRCDPDNKDKIFISPESGATQFTNSFPLYPGESYEFTGPGLLMEVWAWTDGALGAYLIYTLVEGY